MRQKRILILGGNIVQMEATLEAKRQGYYTISADLHEDNPGHSVADEYCKIDIANKDAVLREARRLNIDGLVPYSSDALAPVAAYVSEKMGLPGNPTNVVNTVINKSLFRHFLQVNGFATPWFEVFSSCEEAQRFYQAKCDETGTNKKAIMKPIDSAGSRGIFLVESIDDIGKHWKETISYTSLKQVIIEEFIEREGFQIGGDIFIHDGHIIYYGLGNQHYYDGSHTLTPEALSFPCLQPRVTQDRFKAELQHLVTALGLQSGPCNVELIVGKDHNIYFIDFGPRNGGCNIPYLEKLATGFDENAFTVREAVGDSLPKWNNTAKEQYVMYCRPFIKDSGIYKGLWISETIQKHIIHITPMLEEGTSVRSSGNGNDAVAFVFAKFDCLSELLQVTENLSKHIHAIIVK